MLYLGELQFILQLPDLVGECGILLRELLCVWAHAAVAVDVWTGQLRT